MQQQMELVDILSSDLTSAAVVDFPPSILDARQRLTLARPAIPLAASYTSTHYFSMSEATRTTSLVCYRRRVNIAETQLSGWT